jgi:hypothetical protein
MEKSAANKKTTILNKKKKSNHAHSKLSDNQYSKQQEKASQGIRRKNFSVFTSKIRSDRILLYLVIFTSLILVNIPLLIDYILMNNLLDRIKGYNDAAVVSNLLSGQVLGFYALFYTETYNIYNNKAFTQNEINLQVEIDSMMSKMDDL